MYVMRVVYLRIKLLLIPALHVMYALPAATWTDADVSGWYVYLDSQPGASVFVNGAENGGSSTQRFAASLKSTSAPPPTPRRVLLNHGDRVVIGVTHYTRFHSPRDAAPSTLLMDWTAVNEVRAVFLCVADESDFV